MIDRPTCSIAERIGEVCRYIENHSDEPLTLDVLAAQAAMSKFHFGRCFKAVVGLTPKQFLAGTRMRNFKKALRAAKPIDAAVYDAGYGSASRVYERAAIGLGMTPGQYRRSGAGVSISYAAFDTPLGLMMIGATDRGLCFVQFGNRLEELADAVRREYRNATVEPMREPHPPEFRRWGEAIAAYLSGEQTDLTLPLDVAATAFQARVWRYLQSIPYGEVRSYGEVAAGIGAPNAARAVAQACAGNRVALIIPCHRVIRGTGDLGGYAWGIERKRALLDRERAHRRATAGARVRAQSSV